MTRTNDLALGPVMHRPVMNFISDFEQSGTCTSKQHSSDLKLTAARYEECLYHLNASLIKA